MALLRSLRFAILLLGWCVLAAGASALVVERSGLAASWLERYAGARLVSLGGPLSIGRLEVRWLAPALILEDVRLGERGGLVTLDRLRVDLGLWRAGAGPERVGIEGGRVVVTPGLYHGARELLARRPAAPVLHEEGQPAPRALLELSVSDLEVALESAGERLEVGTLELVLGRRAGGGLALAGVLRQPDVDGSGAARAIHISGEEREEGLLELRAGAPGLVLSPGLLPETGFAGRLRQLEPRGRLRLAGTGTLDLRRRNAVGRLRLSLAGGSLRPASSEHPIEEIALELDARYEPGLGQDPWDPRAWGGHARASCRWRESELVAGALLGRSGRPELLLEAWARVPEAAFEDELLALAGYPRILLDVREGLAPQGGAADVRIGLSLRDGLGPDVPLARGLELVLDAEIAPDTRLAYQGWPNRRGRPEAAFPLPADVRRGRVVVAHAQRLVRTDLVVVEGAVAHGTGGARVVYQGWSPPRDMPPFAPGFGRPESDLLISSPRIAIDSALEHGVRGLGRDPSLDGIWDHYGPAGGEASFALRISQRAEIPGGALDLVLDVQDASARFEDLPVPAHGLEGRVRVRGDGRGGTAAGYALTGRTGDAEHVALAGRTRRHQPRGEVGRKVLDVLALEVRGLASDGLDAEIVSRHLPGVLEATEALRPSGELDLSVTRRREREDAPELTTVELEAGGALALAPEGLETVRELSGRALVHITEVGAGNGGAPMPQETAAEVFAPGLAGHLSGGARVAWRGAAGQGAPGRGTLAATGLLLAEAAALAGPNPPPEGGPADGSAAGGSGGLALEGRVDVLAEIDLDAAEGLGGMPGRVYVHLREDRLGLGAGPLLEDLRGILVVEGGRVLGERLRARLARTEVELLGLTLGPGAEGHELETRLLARRVPLDEAHLAPFLDAHTVHTIVHDLEGRGVIDVEEGRLRLGGLGTDEPWLAFTGDLLLSDVTATLGVPLSIRSASARIDQLVAGAGGVRAFGTLTDLYGRAAGLELGPASLLVTYVGTLLSVEDLAGTFERGWMSSLGRNHATRSGPALSIDLSPPFPFHLGVELSGVDVKRVLHGVFPANVADRGDLDARVRLAGSLDNLLDMHGSGSVELRKTRLWSIPVFRELFSQLGLDRTALFDQVSADFLLEDGRIQVENIEAKSPLLKLVGHGLLDLDGAIESDLEVRYSLVDKIQPLRYLVYLVQNTLLSIAIRGDLERPRVILRGALTRFLRGIGDEERRLPIPAFSPLPERF